LGDSALSLALGWWGFPWGLIVTPVQIARNITGMLKGPDPLAPSAKLERAVRMNIAANAVARQQAQSAVSPGLPVSAIK
jgi:hypothetical protein